MAEDFEKYFTKKNIDAISAYIESFWPKLIRKTPKDHRSLIGLPHPYIIPAASDIFQEQYYWDSYPVVRE